MEVDLQMMHPHTNYLNYRQVVFRSALDFMLVYIQDVLPVLIYSFKEIFLVAPFEKNKAGYMATEVACGWAGAIFEVKEKKIRKKSKV